MKEDYFLAKWLNDQLTSQELDEFKSTSEYAAFEKIKHYSSQLSTPGFNESLVLENVLKTKKVQPKIIAINSRTWISRIAAVLILSLGITYFYLSTKVETQFADNNSKQTFLLPDDSEVVLNSGSNATYNSFKWDNKREINLDGEAYFKVAKGKVFDVITSQGKVTVVGTQFNVKVRNNRLEVVCFEGKVKVTSKNKSVLVNPQQQVIFEDNQEVAFGTKNTTQPSWINAEIDFDKETINNITEEIERQYNINIELISVKSEQRFTGKVPTNDITTALQL